MRVPSAAANDGRAGANPYPGLRPFRTGEAKLFFGRETLDGLLETRVHVSPLTLMFARSGVGKSSFLSCRFIPNLSSRAKNSYLNEWGSAAPEDLIGARVHELLAGGDDFEEKPILILDQFEDVFKSGGNRETLWDALAGIVNVGDAPVNVLISMREEWLGAWGEASDYLPAANTAMMRLAPLRDVEVRRAIIRPAAVQGDRTFEPELAEEILADLKTPNAYGLGNLYVEPGMIQIVCRRLWDEAAAKGLTSVDLALYEALGRADEIVRNFVWSQLRNAGHSGSVFSTYDRVMWAGLTPHLSAAQGVKAIVTPVSVSRKLRTVDLGIAGSAVLDYELTRGERQYLEMAPEKRGEPPAALVTWITRVLNAGEYAGLLKRQRGLPGTANLYELSHDALSPMLQQFAVDLEGWIRSRWYKIVAAGFVLLFLLPALVFAIFTMGFLAAIMGAGLVIGFGAIYVALVWLFMKLATFILESIFFPLIRLLCRGRVPAGTKRSKGK